MKDEDSEFKLPWPFVNFLMIMTLSCLNMWNSCQAATFRWQFDRGCVDACIRNGHPAEDYVRQNNFCYCDDGHRFHLDVGAMWIEEN
jgi:hypothetical protein